MGKRIDITDKLNFDENPVIVVKGKEIEVNTDASTALKVLAMVDNGNASATVMVEMTDLLFTKQGKKNLDSLKLNINDYSKVIEAAMGLVAGDDEDEGEPQKNDGTTSLGTGI